MFTISFSSEKTKFITFCELSTNIKIHSSFKITIILANEPNIDQLVFIQKSIIKSLIIVF